MAELTLERSPAGARRSWPSESVRAWAAGRRRRATRSVSRGSSISAGRPGSRASRSPATTARRSSPAPVPDQAALHGLLNRVCDLGLVIVSVRRLEPEW